MRKYYYCEEQFLQFYFKNQEQNISSLEKAELLSYHLYYATALTFDICSCTALHNLTIIQISKNVLSHIHIAFLHIVIMHGVSM